MRRPLLIAFITAMIVVGVSGWVLARRPLEFRLAERAVRNALPDSSHPVRSRNREGLPNTFERAGERLWASQGLVCGWVGHDRKMFAAWLGKRYRRGPLEVVDLAIEGSEPLSVRQKQMLTKCAS